MSCYDIQVVLPLCLVDSSLRTNKNSYLQSSIYNCYQFPFKRGPLCLVLSNFKAFGRIWKLLLSYTWKRWLKSSLALQLQPWRCFKSVFHSKCKTKKWQKIWKQQNWWICLMVFSTFVVLHQFWKPEQVGSKEKTWKVECKESTRWEWRMWKPTHFGTSRSNRVIYTWLCNTINILLYTVHTHIYIYICIGTVELYVYTLVVVLNISYFQQYLARGSIKFWWMLFNWVETALWVLKPPVPGNPGLSCRSVSKTIRRQQFGRFLGKGVHMVWTYFSPSDAIVKEVL